MLYKMLSELMVLCLVFEAVVKEKLVKIVCKLIFREEIVLNKVSNNLLIILF